MHQLDFDGPAYSTPASVAVKKLLCLFASWFYFFIFPPFSSLNLQVEMAAEEKWKSWTSKQHSGAEQASEKDSCVLLSRQLGEPGRFAYAALCGISLAGLFPEEEQRYYTWAHGDEQRRWLLVSSWDQAGVGIPLCLGSPKGTGFEDSFSSGSLHKDECSN